MPIKITSEKAIERSTFVVTVFFKDEDGNSVSPDSAKWSLVDINSNIVNNRSEVEIESPEAEQDILLKGDDLALLHGRAEEFRWIIIEATYTSNLGTGLPLNEQVRFSILNLKKVA